MFIYVWSQKNVGTNELPEVAFARWQSPDGIGSPDLSHRITAVLFNITLISNSKGSLHSLRLTVGDEVPECLDLLGLS
jgi:hypothetical protein